jgi:hypothetical protein
MCLMFICTIYWRTICIMHSKLVQYSTVVEYSDTRMFHSSIDDNRNSICMDVKITPNQNPSYVKRFESEPSYTKILCMLILSCRGTSMWYNSDQGANDFVRCLDHLRNVCYKHINLQIVFGVMFTELIIVYYLIENRNKQQKIYHIQICICIIH